MLYALLMSTGIVALAEIGDKTQLLALLLAARFRKPWPIVAGIFVATVLNHAIAGSLGAWLVTLVAPETMRWILAASFIAMAAWMLIPDKIDEDELKIRDNAGVFMATLLAFFMAEMGDKTQIATVMLAAKYDSLMAVVVGTTLGMMLANVPAVWLGHRAAAALPRRTVNVVSSCLFALLGIAAALGVSFGM
ncbi:TMEM165/GDT1 family protein [Laribacter hongkongensis]|uniref:TMEM165/GDT1 family protein n=1 Tax=Laribacter hongkongensis TaxID=168471 RepID=UPI001EFEC7E1|nr:TMEM165/GDT1 family protein [Laribacter hongkongensis]MCG9096126.1 TMEM165/GDT1 family protein [Laribacter hongkongensis]